MNVWGVTETQRAHLHDPERHLSALSAIATDALRRGDWSTAYVFADRICRVSVRGRARGLLIRAEAARQLGDVTHANEDLNLALSADPTDALINLHALALPDDEPRLGAAHALVANPNAPDAALRFALATLQRAQAQIIAHIVPCGSRWRGFVSWPPGRRLRYTVKGDTERVSYDVDADPAHPFVSLNAQVSAVAGRRPGRDPVTLQFSCVGDPELSFTVTLPSLCRIGRPPNAQSSGEVRDLTVIVPVYEDAEATSRCLDSLEIQNLPGRRWRVVVVNDASPNAALVADVERRAAEGRIDVITNPTNIGFAAAINRVAQGIAVGDFLLLNADTLLPEGALSRLMAIAQNTPDLGTLTPLSNHGVVTSFPKPFAENEMPSAADLAALDGAARDAALPPVSIPNGIGFCLWVTRACWNAVGGLPLVYGRGYYEDVDFCLDGRRRGFHNLCAMNLIVGHAGSRSFGTARQRLIRANSQRLDARFPDYHAVIDAFRAAQPFRGGFAAIERRMAPQPYDLIVLNPLPIIRPALAARLDQEAAAGCRVLLIECEGGGEDERLRFRGHDGNVPQSLSFPLTKPRGRRDAHAYIRGTGAQRLLIAAPERCGSSLSAWAFSSNVPVELLLAGPLPPAGMMRRASFLTCADGMTFAGAKHALTGILRERLKSPPTIKTSAASAYPVVRIPRLGILSPIPNATGVHLIEALALAFRKRLRPVPIIVLGTTLADLTLMTDPSIIVTGPISITERGIAVRRLAVTALVLPNRDEGFECLEAASADADLPRAYFDRSGGHYPPRSGDLPLDPAIDVIGAAARIADWFGACERIAA